MSDQSQRILVLDTNVLWSQQPFQDSVPWKSLLLYARKYPGAVFVVPEVVLHERARQESDRIAERRAEGTKALRVARAALASAGIAFPTSPTVKELGALNLASRHDLCEQMRKELIAAGIRVAPFPAFSHETLVSWSLDSHRPFDSTDKGYRDALIWRTVCDVAAAGQAGTTTIFVTEDGDYTQKLSKTDVLKTGGPERVLHPDLAADLSAITPNTVLVVGSFKEAIEHLDQADEFEVKTDAQQSDEEASPNKAEDGEALNEQSTDDDIEYEYAYRDREELLRDSIERACDTLIGEEVGSSCEGPGLTFEHEIRSVENATVTAVTPDLSSMVAYVHERFEGETVTGEATVEAEISYDGYVAKANLYGDDRPWSVSIADWNELYALVEGELQAELRFQFVLNGEDVTLEFDSAIVQD